MQFTAIQIILVAIWCFIIAIDQFDFLESLYRSYRWWYISVNDNR